MGWAASIRGPCPSMHGLNATHSISNTAHYALYTIHCILHTICCKLYKILLCAFHTVHCTLHNPTLCTFFVHLSELHKYNHSALYTRHPLLRILHSVQCTVYTSIYALSTGLKNTIPYSAQQLLAEAN